ncbi:hypothetical protein NEMBOFW57_002571 [Staphylotrichum longicolle]|uniref:Uncharacterized protein n=1 Tax=Staphylotrichum longicolle TaxID=669026 RepID=A0AAD4F3R1_9PEZI|nr:hypothetical protein NEMBOFW57_002571 [Staphylotrichum longicolle]
MASRILSHARAPDPDRPSPFFTTSPRDWTPSLRRRFPRGRSLAAGGVYYYAIQEYKASNELLTEDIYALQSAVERLSKYLGTLEEKMEALERRKK